MHRRYCRHRLPVALEAMRNLARSPGWMRVTQGHDLLFHPPGSALRTMMRPPRSVRQRCIAGIVPLYPFVTGLGTDAELLAQPPPVHALLLGKHHELSSLVHDRHLSPRHGSPPNLTNPADFDVSTMSPNRCKLCRRAEHFARNDGVLAPALFPNLQIKRRTRNTPLCRPRPPQYCNSEFL